MLTLRCGTHEARASLSVHAPWFSSHVAEACFVLRIYTTTDAGELVLTSAFGGASRPVHVPLCMLVSRSCRVVASCIFELAQTTRSFDCNPQ